METTNWIYYSNHLVFDARVRCGVVEPEGRDAVDDYVICRLL